MSDATTIRERYPETLAIAALMTWPSFIAANGAPVFAVVVIIGVSAYHLTRPKLPDVTGKLSKAVGS